tara:strand:+ start:3172 stop:4023 length:852 start_codon:yes stop_codon:yes gene_type:complete
MSDSDSDEWEDSDTDYEAQSLTVDITDTIDTVLLPTYSKPEREKMPTTLQLLNVIKTKNTLCLYRCEPANKKYPGIRIPSSFAGVEAVMVSIELHNAVGGPVRTRLPNFKSKGLTSTRRKDVVFIVRPKTDTIYFKKKCQDKYDGKDAAFELGGGFSSHTGEITPQFTIVMAPFVKGKIVLERAVRTPKFHVFSKRQDRHTVRTKKRHKKNTEILKMDTNIREATTTLEALKQELSGLRHRTKMAGRINVQIRQMTEGLSDGPIKIALEYGTRTQQSNNFISV